MHTNAAAYVVSKHGVIGLTKNAAIEYATRGIRVNAGCQGFMDTPRLNRVGITTNTETERAIAEAHPMRRLWKPDESAALVV
ncbi:MAG: SDR family oxidoreductase [Candidatus Thermoplasmatota archaeon]|nr:SDR family oxidoreductase [Candidatus Thermoplasmatota archaeon]